MDNVMTNGFAELSADEMVSIDGGKNGWAVAGGVVGAVIVGAGCVAAAPVIAAGGGVAMGVGCLLGLGSAVSGGLIGGGLWG